VEPVDDANAVVEDIGLVLDKTVGRQPPIVSPIDIAPRVA
jgi:hypothetical protein